VVAGYGLSKIDLANYTTLSFMTLQQASTLCDDRLNTLKEHIRCLAVFSQHVSEVSGFTMDRSPDAIVHSVSA